MTDPTIADALNLVDGKITSVKDTAAEQEWLRHVALAAMTTLLQLGEYRQRWGASETALAKDAWRYAEAFVAEEKERAN